jgi:signal transduction histidine kinase/HAMP domain-containing protein
MFASLRKVALRLGLLAGVPVIGVLLLSAEIEEGARTRARSADAIGSVEDLAELSVRMTNTVDQLQTERAAAALALGWRGADPPVAASESNAMAGLLAQEGKTDAAITAMDGFLAQRDVNRLPVRLNADLSRAHAGLTGMAAERKAVADGSASIAQLLDFYGSANASLIDATAALTRLSTDGEMLRALSSLVAVMQVKECDSREHAVLSHTFANGEFAPGMYRYLVALVTERSVHVASLLAFATADQVQMYQQTLALPASARSASMLQKALGATEEKFEIDASDWFETQQRTVNALAVVEAKHAEHVRQTARSKLAETRRAIRYGRSLVASVVLVSVLLAVAIGRGITRSVSALATVAGRVREQKDFSLRVVKTSEDEFGALTDAFNEMLSGVEMRDEELRLHREHLEELVASRTAALSKRNEDMRLVLDTVEQGLATLSKDGHLSAERSGAFDSFFGRVDEGIRYFSHIAADNSELASSLELDWSRLTSGAVPIEQVLPEINRRVQVGERHFALAYKPILQNAEVTGALLTVSDVTSEIADTAARERLEKELQLAQKLEGIGQLAAGVAHEINTPMQYVGDNINFLARAFEKLGEHLADVGLAVAPDSTASLQSVREQLDKSKARLKLKFLLENTPKALRDSKAGIEHVSNIVRAMKSFAHVDQDEKTTSDINQAIRDTLMVAQNEYKSVAVVATDLGEIPEVVCFPGRLNQVLLNLVVNAAHAVAEAKRESGGKIGVRSRAEDGVVAVTVSDNGTGIPAHVQRRVFDPFFTTKPVGKGTGQGLSLARSIVVDAHGGTLSFETEPGQGTAFTIRLPIDGRSRLAPLG